MDYRQAQRIRQRSLSDVIAANLVAGESTLGAVGKAISQKTAARFTRIKEKFDPLNIVKFMTGGSKLAPALLGRMLGRSQRDIEYFAGTARILSKRSTASRLHGLHDEGSNLDILTSMYAFMKKTQENEMRRFELKRNYEEENKLEDEKRHKELLKALGGETIVGTSSKKRTGKGFFESLFDFFSDLKPMLDFFKDLFKVFTKMGLGLVLNLFSVLGSPAFLMLAAGAATIMALRELLFKLAEVTPNMKAMSPAEAQSVLQNGTPQQIEAMGGEDYLKDIIKNQRQRAVAALKMPEGEEKDKAIRNLGGLDKVQQIAGDTKVYDIPENIDKGLEKVAPRPKTGGVALKSKQEEWDRKWGKYYDPETGLRKDLATQKSEGTSVPTPVTPPAAPASNAGQTLNAVSKQNAELNLPKSAAPAVTKNEMTTTQTQNKQTLLSRLDKLSVRNNEETFQRMIYYSTRVV